MYVCTCTHTLLWDAVAAVSSAGNMQSAVDEKKKLELRLDNVTSELNKAKAHAAELDGSKQQLQVLVTPLSNQSTACECAVAVKAIVNSSMAGGVSLQRLLWYWWHQAACCGCCIPWNFMQLQLCLSCGFCYC
jgi:hypothetical protein